MKRWLDSLSSNLKRMGNAHVCPKSQIIRLQRRSKQWPCGIWTSIWFKRGLLWRPMWCHDMWWHDMLFMPQPIGWRWIHMKVSENVRVWRTSEVKRPTFCRVCLWWAEIQIQAWPSVGVHWVTLHVTLWRKNLPTSISWFLHEIAASYVWNYLWASGEHFDIPLAFFLEDLGFTQSKAAEPRYAHAKMETDHTKVSPRAWMTDSDASVDQLKAKVCKFKLKGQDNQICPQDAASNNTEPGSPWWIQKSALERWCMVMNKCSTCHQKRMWKHYQRMMITQKLTHQNSGMIMEHKKCGPDPRTNILRILSLRVDWQTLDSSAQCSQNCWQRNHVSSNISMELLSFPTQRLHDLLCKGSNPALGVSGRGVQASTATHETQDRWHHCHHGFHPMCHQAKKEPNSQPEILVAQRSTRVHCRMVPGHPKLIWLFWWTPHWHPLWEDQITCVK